MGLSVARNSGAAKSRAKSIIRQPYNTYWGDGLAAGADRFPGAPPVKPLPIRRRTARSVFLRR